MCEFECILEFYVKYYKWLECGVFNIIIVFIFDGKILLLLLEVNFSFLVVLEGFLCVKY